MKFYLLLSAIILFVIPAAAKTSVNKQTQTLLLGESRIKINVYKKSGANVTFFAPHYNEQTALKLTKAAIAQKGGRLVEIESFDQNGNPARRIDFIFKGKSYSVDPNRIFTENGRRCADLKVEIQALVESFSTSLLAIIFSENENRLSDGKEIVVAVHNNVNVDEVKPEARAGDLTATAFVKNASHGRNAFGAFEAQAAGVFFSNFENDPDNFIFLSSPRFLGFFADNNFTAVVQKSGEQLTSSLCGIDDGSLSVYAGQKNIEYICLEADAANGYSRQQQMFDAVYRLFSKTIEKTIEKSETTVPQNAFKN